MTALQGFLVGVIATCSLTAGLFFLKFWRRTRDSLFLAFGAAFLIEGFNRVGLLVLDHPNEGSWTECFVRILASLLILGAILRKNYGRGGSRNG